MNGNFCVFRYLVSRGCDVNNHRRGRNLYDTALHVACEEGNLDLVKLMMENGGKKIPHV